MLARETSVTNSAMCSKRIYQQRGVIKNVMFDFMNDLDRSYMKTAGGDYYNRDTGQEDDVNPFEHGARQYQVPPTRGNLIEAVEGREMGRRTALYTVRFAGRPCFDVGSSRSPVPLAPARDRSCARLAMHAALLGVPQEERSSWPQAIANVHHVYGVRIVWPLVTVVALVIERFLTVAVLKGTSPQSTVRVPSTTFPWAGEHIPETGASPHGAASEEPVLIRAFWSATPTLIRVRLAVRSDPDPAADPDPVVRRFRHGEG